MRMIKNIIFIVFVFMNLGGFVFGQNDSKEKIIADYIYNLPQFLEWTSNNMTVITIGVLGAEPNMLKELKKMVRREYADWTTLALIEYTSIDDIQETHLLYIGSSYNRKLYQINRKIAELNTVLLTDNYENKKMVMINFYEKNGSIFFDYNVSNMQKAQIKVKPNIKELGGREINDMLLYNESQKELRTEQEKVKFQQEQIKIQKEEITEQQAYIKEQQDEIIEQQKEIVIQESYIKEQKAELSSLITQAEIQRKELDAKVEELNIKSKEIIEKRIELNKKQKEVSEQNSILVDQSSEIQERQKYIENQKDEMTRQNLTIQFQKNILTVFIGLFVIILFLIFFILRSYRIKQQDNIKLERQKEEIEQKTEELELINTELEKLSIVASETSTAVIILDKDGGFEWVNPGFTRMYGYTLQLLINELDENIRNASTFPNIEEYFTKCIAEKHPVIYETHITTRWGNEKWAQSTLSPILGSNGEVRKLVIIDSDITKIKEAEIEILERNKKIRAQASELVDKNHELEKLSLVASKTDSSVIIARPDGEIEWVNDGFTRMLGISYKQFKEEYGSNLFSSSLNPELRADVELAIKEKRSHFYTAPTITKNGQKIWIQTTLTPIFDKNGALRKLIAIDADVTKIKLAEEEIALQKEKIMDSITYARRIQNAVLPRKKILADSLKDYFIFFRPRDIVSGDFYWSTKIENKLLIAAADSTGHGVPGAFMSMLGISFLNEIVSKMPYDKIEAHTILNQLRENVKKSLHQTGKEGEAKDGMDIAFCVVDLEINKLQYAGAHNPLLIVRNNEIVQYRADDMPIGIFYNEKESFTNHVIDIEPNDRFYIFSDGYPDQFGGERGRKFMIKRFKQMLIEIHQLPMNEQEKILDTRFKEWKNGTRQIDDVLVMGFEV